MSNLSRPAKLQKKVQILLLMFRNWRKVTAWQSNITAIELVMCDDRSCLHRSQINGIGGHVGGGEESLIFFLPQSRLQSSLRHESAIATKVIFSLQLNSNNFAREVVRSTAWVKSGPTQGCLWFNKVLCKISRWCKHTWSCIIDKSCQDTL